jgi:hypothetical protein
MKRTDTNPFYATAEANSPILSKRGAIANSGGEICLCCSHPAGVGNIHSETSNAVECRSLAAILSRHLDILTPSADWTAPNNAEQMWASRVSRGKAKITDCDPRQLGSRRRNCVSSDKGA